MGVWERNPKGKKIVIKHVDLQRDIYSKKRRVNIKNLV
jgi:hypothetical protein